MSMHDDILKVLVSEEELKAKVAELGAQISKDYEGRNLVLVSILKGSVVFMADLMRAVSIPCSIDFMVVSSYGGGNTTSTGLVKIIKDLDGDLSGKDVLIVEDILDTGITLSNLVPMLKMRNPNSVKICTILDKPSRRKADIAPDLSLIHICPVSGHPQRRLYRHGGEDAGRRGSAPGRGLSGREGRAGQAGR